MKADNIFEDEKLEKYVETVIDKVNIPEDADLDCLDEINDPSQLKRVKVSEKKKEKKRKVRIRPTHPMKRRDIMVQDVKVKETYHLPQEQCEDVYSPGTYTIYRMHNGQMKMFDPQDVEIYANTFYFHVIRYLEGLDDEQIRDMKIDQGGRMAGYRLLRVIADKRAQGVIK